MIAKIIDKDGSVYTSNILGIKSNGWKTKIIAFDKENSNIICIYYWQQSKFLSLKRGVFIFDNSEDNWITKGKWKGFDWLVENKQLMHKLQGGFFKKAYPVPAETIEQAKKYACEINLPEWNQIKNQADIDSLLSVSFGFHDAVIESQEKTDKNLTVNFDTTWGCHVILDCDDVVDFNLENLMYILDSNIKFDNNLTHWYVESGGPVDYNNSEQDPDWYIKAGKISWKLIID